jgi:hypothetical protein
VSYTEFQLRNGTASQWSVANTVLFANEIGLENDTGFIKIGNGSTGWNLLPYYDSTIRTNSQTSSYTLAFGDLGSLVEINSSSATTLTIPPNSSVNFPIGALIEIFQYGTGQVTLVGGEGVTLRTFTTLVLSQFLTAQLRQRAKDEWIVSNATPGYDS